ncbi:MAG: urease accessory protein UreD [Kiloniellales bacterium]|nr:urease accessory protein UreD [Kiloniellales bacterium]
MPGLPDRDSGARVIPFPKPPRLERARGEAAVAFAGGARGTAVADLYQAGCAKLRLPAPEPGRPREAVLINTAGGLTDGDLLRQRVAWEADSEALVTSQAAERIYRSRQDWAAIDTALTVGPRARALWLPQETILFDGAKLRRATEVEIDGSAELIACEGLVFGRHAMGEEVNQGAITESWRISSAGRLLFADTFRLEGPIAGSLARPAVADGAKALATLLYVGPDAPGRLARLRDLPEEGALRAASSALGPVVVTRVLADSGAALRRAVTAALAALRGTSDMPRVWSC